MLRNIITMFAIFIIWQFPLFLCPLFESIFAFDFIIWYLFTSFIIFMMLSFSIFNYIRNNNISNNYILYGINTYICYSAFSIFLFFFNNLFYSYLFSLLSLLFGIMFYLENRKTDRDNSVLILPYLFWLLSLSVTIILIVFL